VLVARETQGRGGKGVTVVSGLPLAGTELEALAKQLKQRCGSGGKLREDGVIEIQGEHRDRLLVELGKLGHRVKRAGG
jgi:translation initiation factor 1